MTLSHLYRAGATALFLALLVPAGWGLFGQEPDEPPPLPVPGKLTLPSSEPFPPPDEPASAAPVSEEARPLEAEKTAVPAGIDVQTRGPLHEAYAQPSDSTPQVGPVVPRD